MLKPPAFTCIHQPKEHMPRQDTDFTMKEWPGRGLLLDIRWEVSDWPSKINGQG
jgi:hypothetical protein